MSDRPYQQRAIAQIVATHRQGGSTLLDMPTGTGKTYTTMRAVRELGVPTCAMVHTRDLVANLRDAARGAGLRVGDSKTPASDVDIRIDTVQATWRELDACELLVVDEAHRAAARTYQTRIGQAERALRLLLTATPERNDAATIAPLVDEHCKPITVREAMTAGYLVSEIRYYQGQIPDGLDDVPRSHGEYQRRAQGQVFERPQVVGDLVQTWLDRWRDRQGVVTCSTVADAETTAAALDAAGISAVCLHGGSEHREDVIGLARAGWIQALVCADLLIEGVDVPGLSLAVIKRRTTSPRVLRQFVGRVLRPAGAPDAIVYDMADNLVRLSQQLGVHPIEDEIPFDLGATEGRQAPPRAATSAMGVCEACFAIVPVAPVRPTTCPRCGEPWPAPVGRQTRWVVRGTRVVEIDVTPPDPEPVSTSPRRLPRQERHEHVATLRRLYAQRRDRAWVAREYERIRGVSLEAGKAEYERHRAGR